MNQDNSKVIKTKLSAAEAKKKARKAYDNSKWRCGNDPSYLNTKFLFSSFPEFLQSAGLPVSKDLSLDRINPAGHYEPGNVRWAVKAVQVANKKHNKYASTAPLGMLQQKYLLESQQKQLRFGMHRAWQIAVRSFNQGFVTLQDMEWLKENPIGKGWFSASFDLNQALDVAEQPGIFHLPSLTNPGSRVRLRGRSTEGSRKKSDVVESLGHMELISNLSDLERSWVIKDWQHHTGAAWIHDFESGGWGPGVEGAMMAAAARIRVTQKISTAFRPAISAVEELSSVGWNWDNCDRASEPVLDAQILFIPDYQIDQGEGFLLDYQDKSRLSRLLNYRRKHGLKTWVGIQNPHKLTEEEKKLILGNYVIRDLSPVSQTSLPEPESIIPKWSPQFYDIPNGTWNLRGLATLEGLGYLFKA